jgi:hypothetical protein
MKVVFKLALSLYILIVFIIIINHHIFQNDSIEYCNNILTKNKTMYIQNIKTEKMYKIKYDFKKKNTHIICDCIKGKVFNEFSDINVFDLKNREKVVLNKKCLCDKSYEKDDTFIYGNNHIKRYMINDDDSYFYMV